MKLSFSCMEYINVLPQDSYFLTKLIPHCLSCLIILLLNVKKMCPVNVIVMM